MKKIHLIFIILAVAILVAITFNVYEEVKAIKNAKIEIYDVKVEKLIPNIVLNLSIKIINGENRGIDDLTGNFNIYIINFSIGELKFHETDIPPHSFTNINVMLTLYYNEIAKSIIYAIEKMDFKLSLKGNVRGKIFFGLLSYKNPVEASYQYV
ncbi:MAG TPA: hypothetical protein ENI33_05935 [Thermoplasmatales archaeon]|nr:hypothetical protein [Thermoplasmatales archaeon]